MHKFQGPQNDQKPLEQPPISNPTGDTHRNISLFIHQINVLFVNDYGNGFSPLFFFRLLVPMSLYAVASLEVEAEISLCYYNPKNFVWEPVLERSYL
jgi:hypothetical protein